jgi:hypothetical protein
MKRSSAVAWLFILLVALFWAPQKAIGFGLGLSSSVGSGTLKEKRYVSKSFFDSHYEITNNSETRESVGFVYDSNLVQDDLFNYRLSLSYLLMQLGSASEHGNMNGISVEHDLGIGLIRNKSFRLWIGPELSIAVLDRTLIVGAGPVVGANIDMGNDYVISLKGGYIRGSEFMGEAEKHWTLSLSLMRKFGGDKAPR